MKKLLLIFGFVLFSVLSHAQSSSNEEALTEQKIKVFPNPATSVVKILGLINTDNANISIANTYGSTVLSYQWKITNNALNIPISSLDSGIYIVTIRSGEYKVQTKFYKK